VTTQLQLINIIIIIIIKKRVKRLPVLLKFGVNATATMNQTTAKYPSLVRLRTADVSIICKENICPRLLQIL